MVLVSRIPGVTVNPACGFQVSLQILLDFPKPLLEER
jgi:hypothetical protein